MSKSYGPLVDRLLVTKWKRIWKRNKIQVYHNSSTEKNVPSWICCYFFNWRPHVLVFSIELSQPLGRKLKQMNECNATVVAGFVIWGMLRIFRRLLVKPRSCFDGQGAERAKKSIVFTDAIYRRTLQLRGAKRISIPVKKSSVWHKPKEHSRREGCLNERGGWK